MRSTDAPNRSDRATRLIVWLLAGMMVFSFGVGVAMFVPAEHRAQKLDEMMAKYKARARRVATEQPTQRW